MQFSIVIPTLNEEKYVYTLLDCLTHQTYKEFEVIVIDGNSEDKTKEIVSRYLKELDLTLIDSPKRGVSFQRNYAASKAKNPRLIFFDADVMIEPDFLEKINKFLETRLATNRPADMLTAWNIPISDKRVDLFMYWFFNHIYMEMMKNYKPGAVGTFICVDKKAFDSVNGFSEKVWPGEDFDLIKRLFCKGYKYSLLKDPKVYFSVRRLNKEGRAHFAWKILVQAFYYQFKGSIEDPKHLQKYFRHEVGKFNDIEDAAFVAVSSGIKPSRRKKSKPAHHL
jgi:glycosyltransferase involved in cell wall biosynthesis